MNYLHVTKWEQNFERGDEPGTVYITKWKRLPDPKEWAKMMIFRLLQIIEIVVFIGSLGFLTCEVASMWLFSEIWEKE